MSLSRFFETYYHPTRLLNADPKTVQKYAEVMRMWTVLTGDPPLEQITSLTLSRFQESLSHRRGKSRGSRISSNTVQGLMRHVQFVLDKAGPPGPRNRDAADMIPRAPWIRPTPIEAAPPRILTAERIDAVYLAAVGMDKPRLPGIRAPLWWQTLIVVALNTMLRRRTLFALRMENVDWKQRRLLIPGRSMKSKRFHSVPLNPIAFEHLLRMRTDREMVFPWRAGVRHFYNRLHYLQNLAGIPLAEHFGLHALRKTMATWLWESNPQAAQFALGHTNIGVTMKYYVAGADMVARALDRVRQPKSFADAMDGRAPRPSGPAPTLTEQEPPLPSSISAGLPAESRGVPPGRASPADVDAAFVVEAQALFERGRQMQEEAARRMEELHGEAAGLAVTGSR